MARRRRRNPTAFDLIPWLIGGAAVVGGVVLYRQNQAAQAQIAATAAALASTQAKLDAKPTTAAPAVTSINYQLVIDILQHLSATALVNSPTNGATIIGLMSQLEAAIGALEPADATAIAGENWYLTLQSQNTVLKLTPPAFNGGVFQSAANLGVTAVTTMQTRFNSTGA